MRQKRIIRGAAEQDALTRSRRFYVWTQRAGAVDRIKRRYRRRERHDASRALRHQTGDDD